MSTVDGMTAAAMQAIANASVVSGEINGDGHLILTTAGGSTSDAGVAKGSTGATGPTGPAGAVGVAPTGAVVMYAASIPPLGWLVCDGSPVSRTTYSALFTVISTVYGSGDGSTTFNVPDLRQKYPRMGTTGADLAGNGGSTNHTHPIATHDHVISGGSPAAVAHVLMQTGTAPNVYMERITGSTSYTANFQGDATTVAGSSFSTTVGAKVDGNVATGGPSATQSNGTDHIPPYLNFNFMIKT